MKRKVIRTGDGSHTLEIFDGAEHYHSIHGAVQESRHVYVEMGLQSRHRAVEALSILEIGLGTGLNAMLTMEYAQKHGLQVRYTTLEAFPLQEEEWSLLNYDELISFPQVSQRWQELHRAAWGKPIKWADGFELLKIHEKVQDVNLEDSFDVVYFDAFGPRHQPEMWEDAVFEKMYSLMRPEGVLVTYSAKGEVRRAMTRSGFAVERLPGPPGKREMLRATKS